MYLAKPPKTDTPTSFNQKPTTAKSKFLREAGKHFVSYKLATKRLHVGLTLGYMPHIDLLLSSNSGLRSISLQNKNKQRCLQKKQIWS